MGYRVPNSDGGRLPGRPERDECDPQTTIEALEDEDSRELIECTDTPKTVSELAEECGLPLSTAYRKINRLHEAGLLARTTRVSAAANHPAQYERAVENVSISLVGGFEIECQCARPTPASRQSAWAD